MSAEQEFRLRSDGPGEKLAWRYIALAIVFLLAGMISMSLFDSWLPLVLIGIAPLLLLLGPLPAVGSRHGTGIVRMTDEGLRFQAIIPKGSFGAAIHKYRWSHIANIEVLPFSESSRPAKLVSWTIGKASHESVVVLKLGRSLRSPWLGGFGTDWPGIPSLFLKQVILVPEDPALFASAANPFLRRRASVALTSAN